MKRTIISTLFALILPVVVMAQGVPVSLAPVPAQQFFSSAGTPLASGCIYTFVSGSSTPLATYVDGTGTGQNPNPVRLDAGGFGNLWLTNSSYRFQIWSFGSGAVGSNCGNGTLQRTVDNVSAYTIINQAQNLFLSGNTSDPGGSAGELIYRSDIPCFRGFTSLWDCFVRLTDTQTLTNKTLTSPTITTPSVTGGTFANPFVAGVNAQTGTSYTVASSDEQKLVTLSNASPVAVTLPQATTAGFGAGAVFHLRNLGAGAATITPTTSTIDGLATLQLLSGQGVDVYSDGANFETQRGASGGVTVACTNFTPVSVTNNTSLSNLQSCTIPAGILAQGSLLKIEAIGLSSTSTGTPAQQFSFTVGGGTACSIVPAAVISGTSNQPWNSAAFLFIVTGGSSGTANWSCNYFGTANIGGTSNANGSIALVSINTTVSNVVQIQALANTNGGTITENGLKVTVY